MNKWCSIGFHTRNHLISWCLIIIDGTNSGLLIYPLFIEVETRVAQKVIVKGSPEKFLLSIIVVRWELHYS